MTALLAPAITAVTLTEPLPGFPRHRDYVVVPADRDGRFHWVQSVTDDGPRFLAVPAACFPDYAPVLPPAVRAELDLADGEPAPLFCLVTVPGGDPTAATANLRAPLVVNPGRGRARQVVLGEPLHPIRAPLPR